MLWANETLWPPFISIWLPLPPIMTFHLSWEVISLWALSLRMSISTFRSHQRWHISRHWVLSIILWHFWGESMQHIKHELWPILHGLSLFPALETNHIPLKVWDEITYPFPNFNGAVVEVWEWTSYFIAYFLGLEQMLAFTQNACRN